MKTLYTGLFIIGAFVIGLNMGVSWGITSKPVLDLDKCQEVTRYEDNSLVCKAAGREYTMDSDDGARTVQDTPRGTTMTGADLQPAEVATRLQPADQVQRTAQLQVTIQGAEVQPTKNVQ